jgi:hypothetical protein
MAWLVLALTMVDAHFLVLALTLLDTQQHSARVRNSTAGVLLLQRISMPSALSCMQYLHIGCLAILC